jgi:CRISPR-associated protein Cas6
MSDDRDQIVEMRWAVMGDRIPSEHGYRLYSALIEKQPQLKQVDWQLSTINGIPDGQAWIKLGSHSSLAIRVSICHLFLFDLDNQILRVGQCLLKLGAGEGQSLNVCDCLTARIVTIKRDYRSRVSEFEFGVSLGKQLNRLGIDSLPVLGNRQALKIKDAFVVGYSVSFENLRPQESLILQRQGLGGRRKMGCGFFKEKNNAKSI